MPRPKKRPDAQYERFESLAKRLVAVPKDEIKRKEPDKAKQKKRGD